MLLKKNGENLYMRNGDIVAADNMRQEWAQSDAERDKGLKEPENIEKKLNITYAASATEDEEVWHLTDIYYPGEERKETFPVIVSVHGGGWFYGDKELYRFYTMQLAAMGFAVVNFNYRRSPEYHYPAGFMDVCSLMHFLQEHKEEYRLDMEQLFIVGDSAGAQLASQYGIFATNPEYRRLFDEISDFTAPIPKKMALNCGIYDLGEIFRKDVKICDWYLPECIKKKEAISFFRIMEYMTKDFPPVYLMASVNDSLAKHSLPMKQRLEELEVPVIFREFGEDAPEDGHVFHLNMRSENGKRCNQEEIEFFKTNQ
jgi:acetyl esterase/lipase